MAWVHEKLRPSAAVMVAVPVCIAAACGAAPDERNVPAAVAETPWREALSPGSAAGFDLLLVTLDTTRADRIGCYGYLDARTPNLDRMATEGLRVVDAVSPAPMTLPAHASLLTGLYPPRHGVRTNGRYRLDPTHVTLAELLQQVGYRTAAFVSSFVLDARFGLDQGFDHYDGRVDSSSEPTFGAQNERPAEAVTDAALAWLGTQEPGLPVFLWVHYFDPHHPYVAGTYDGEIATVDRHLGRLVAAFKAVRGRDRIVVVAGDHGESLGEHGERYHSRTLYEGAVRVPLLLWAPGLLNRAARLEGIAISLVDLLPTIGRLLGLEVPAQVDGADLVALEPDPDRAVYLETLSTYFDNGWAPLFAARSHRSKLIHAPEPELYALDDDPAESVNRWADSSGLTKGLEAAIERWLGETPSLDEAVAAARAVDPETERRLESLGYAARSRRVSEDPLPDPKDMLPLYEDLVTARDLVAAGEIERALSLVRSVVARAPDDPTALHQLGELLAVTGETRRAEEALRRAFEISPRPELGALLAQVLMEMGKLAEADALLDQAVALDPLHGAVWVARGDLMVFSGQLESAQIAYRRAIEVDPYRAAGVARSRLQALDAQRRTPPDQ